MAKLSGLEIQAILEEARAIQKEEGGDLQTIMFARFPQLIQAVHDAERCPVYLTNPSNGSKVTCHKCKGFIEENTGEIGYHDHQHPWDFPNIWFHKDCYDPEVDFWSHIMN